LGEEPEDLLLALVVAGQRAAAGDVPHEVVGEELVDGVHVALLIGGVALAQQLDVGVLGHGAPPFLPAIRRARGNPTPRSGDPLGAGPGPPDPADVATLVLREPAPDAVVLVGGEGEVEALALHGAAPT